MSGLQGVETSGPSKARKQEIRAELFTQASAEFEEGTAQGVDLTVIAQGLGYNNAEDWFETQVAEFRRLKMPIPERPGFMRDDTWDLDKLVALADQLGSKLRPEDVTPGLRSFATSWLRELPTPISFDYLRDMRFQIETKGGNKPLTVAQAKGVLNCAVQAARRGVDKPKAQATPLEPVQELEAAIYFKDGVVYKVVRAVHGSGKMYAKRLVAPEVEGAKAHFEYAQGAIRELRPEMRMTLEQAREFGALYGVCCNCGATLTDETSIELGIGPVCRSKFAA